MISLRAWLLREPCRLEEGDPLEYVEVEDPQPGPGEIRLSVRACGVCHTDLHTVEGELEPPRLPVIPGHEVVGVVDEVGPGVEGITIGERRGVYWLHEACGECEPCRRGDENLCESPRFTGLHANGGYAEKIVVPARYTVPIPAVFDDHEAAPLLCAGIIGYRSLRLSELQPGERLALFGFGASAHLVLQVARHWGCEVVVYTRSEEHQRHALELGALWAGPPGQDIPLQADRAITFAPAGWIVPHALRAVRPGGTVALNAIYMTDIPSIPYSLLYRERTLRSVANVTRRDAVEFMEVAGEIPLRAHTVLYPFEEANQALRDVKGSVIKGAAVLVLAAPASAATPNR